MAATLSVLAGTANAGRLDKAFEALRVYNYFEARRLFLQQVDKEPAPSCYGLSVITGRTDNPFHHLDSSYHWVLRADSAFRVLEAPAQARLLKWSVDAAAIADQKRAVEQAAWERARKAGSMEAYLHYINLYGSAPERQDAVAARDSLAYRAARSANSAAAYRTFMDGHPEAEQRFEARSRWQEAVYREAVAGGGIVAYESFIAEHPDSPHLADAEDRLYQLAVPKGTVEELGGFIRRYPRNRNVGTAWRTIYGLEAAGLGVDALTRFAEAHPDYPFMDELAAEIEVAGLRFLPYREEGRWGFIDEQGRVRIPARYEFVGAFVDGQAQVGLDGSVGRVDRSGQVIIPIRYEEVVDPSEGLSVVEAGDSAGAVDRAGRMVIPMRYEDLGESSGGLSFARMGGRYGYVDGHGVERVPFEYEEAASFIHGVAVVRKAGAFGVIDRQGAVVVPCRYDWIDVSQPGAWRMRVGERMGLLSPFGDVLVPAEHDYIGTFSDGLALVVTGGSCMYVRRDGAPAFAHRSSTFPAVRTEGDFHNGVARVMVNGRFALIDTTGERIFPAQYAEIGLMEADVVPVRKKQKWGYATRGYTTLVEAKYDGAWELHHGFARVRVGDRFGSIDPTGREVVAPRFTALADVQHGHLVASMPEGTGLITPDGRTVVPFTNDAVEVIAPGIARLVRGERFAYMRLDDREIVWMEAGFGERSGSAE